MLLAKIPDFETVCRDQAEQIALASRAVEDATERAATYIEKQHLAFEPSGHASLVRMHIRDYVARYGQDMEVSQEELKNCGVLLTWPGFRMHVVKSDNGEPPAPGDSQSGLSYCNQGDPDQLRIPWPGSLGFLETEDVLHLIQHWLCGLDGRLTRILLACPIAATPSRVVSKWNNTLQHPALQITRPLTTDPSQEVAKPANLPFRARKIGEDPGR